MRRFYLERREDESGISGTGKIAEGVVFSTGDCALNWLTNYRSICVYRSIEELRKIHGHGDKTLVVYVDDYPCGSVKKASSPDKKPALNDVKEENQLEE